VARSAVGIENLLTSTNISSESRGSNAEGKGASDGADLGNLAEVKLGGLSLESGGGSGEGSEDAM